MAFIGMRYPVVAKIANHTHGSMPAYSKGMVIGRAIMANMAITRNNNPLWGDDVIAEDDNGITGMSADLGVDDVGEDVRVYAMALDERKTEDGTGVIEYDDTDESAPYVGMGYIRVRRRKAKVTYQGTWIFKCTFSEEAEESKSKGETIEWKTPTIKVRAAGVVIDGSGKIRFRRRANFQTEEEAIAWLNKMANIEASEPVAAKTEGTPVAAADETKANAQPTTKK